MNTVPQCCIVGTRLVVNLGAAYLLHSGVCEQRKALSVPMSF